MFRELFFRYDLVLPFWQLSQQWRILGFAGSGGSVGMAAQSAMATSQLSLALPGVRVLKFTYWQWGRKKSV
jgi:hypothetical protein